jgi:hypothetical protein
MFNCLWLRAERAQPLHPRLYQRSYGRTYGRANDRRPSPVDQPVVMPDTLRVFEMLTLVSSPKAERNPDPAIADAIHRAA